MTREPQAPGTPASILCRQVDRDDNIHAPHEDNYFRIKILAILLLDQKYYAAALRSFYENVRTSDGVQIVAVPGEIHASN